MAAPALPLFIFLFMILFFGLSVVEPAPLKMKSIKVAAFNIQILGKTKAEKTDVMSDLAEIIKDFDITLIQEIREKEDRAITKLMSDLNSHYDGKWAYKQSGRLGRTSSKEQYAYIYNEESLQVLKTYQYDDSQHDYFEREPYGVLVDFEGNKFGLVGIHTDPDDAEKEIDRLVDVYDDAKKHLGTEDMLLLGDFNAGCSYVTRTEWTKIRLVNDKRFTWLINSTEDTTVSNTDCPYDRIVMAGEGMRALVGGSRGQIYRFDEKLGLTQDEAKDRSDHYPIFIQLYDTGPNIAVTIHEQNFSKTLFCLILFVLQSWMWH